MNPNDFEKTIKILAFIIILALFFEIGIAFFISNKNKKTEQEKTKIEKQLKEEIQNTIEKSGEDQSYKKPSVDEPYKEPSKEPAKEVDPIKIKSPQIPQR